MFDELKKYKNKGHFFFSRDDSLKEVSRNVPNLPGVYFIVRLSYGRVEIVYIGKSVSIEQNGRFNDQGFHGTLNDKQEEVSQQAFFKIKCEQEEIDALDIYWFVTFDKNHHDLPCYVEGAIMQRFFEVQGRLPEWNKAF